MNLLNYRVVTREGGGFDYLNVTTGKVLLTTENVSIETLLRLALEDSF